MCYLSDMPLQTITIIISLPYTSVSGTPTITRLLTVYILFIAQETIIAAVGSKMSVQSSWKSSRPLVPVIHGDTPTFGGSHR